MLSLPVSSAVSVLLPLEITGRQLENRLSTVSAGISLTSIIFLLLTSQVGLYFWTRIHNRDPLWIKGFVIFIWVIQALEFATSCHMTVVAHAHDSALSMEQLKESLWSMAVYIITCAVTECLVHAYFISRIYIFEANQAHIISAMLCIILVLEGAFGFISMLSVVIPKSNKSKYVVLFWPFPIWLGLSIVMDVFIAGSLYYNLKKGGPLVSKRLKLLVKRLTRFCIQTGLITSLVTGITVALWTVAQLDRGHLFMSFPVGGIYATCLMANLIARESYFHSTQLGSDTECFEMAIETIVFTAPQDVEKDDITACEVN